MIREYVVTVKVFLIKTIFLLCPICINFHLFLMKNLKYFFLLHINRYILTYIFYNTYFFSLNTRRYPKFYSISLIHDLFTQH